MTHTLVTSNSLNFFVVYCRGWTRGPATFRSTCPLWFLSLLIRIFASFPGLRVGRNKSVCYIAPGERAIRPYVERHHGRKDLVTKILKVSGMATVLWVLTSLAPGLAEAAQAPPYSADSLMATFEKGSKTSLKGTSIAFSDVVSEIRQSRVTFRSSTNAKVICELVSSTDVRNGGFSLGSRLTVVGKVRGRGILGNVTLDECSLAPSLFAGNEPRPVAAEPAHEEPKEPEHHAEEPIGQPVEIPIAEAPTADAPTRPVSTRPTSPVRSVLPTKTVANTVPPTERPSSQPAQPLPATSECEPRSSASARLPSALHAFAGLLVGFGAHFMLVRFRPRRAYAIRPSAGGVTTEEARRAALEALLLGQKKKNS
jgi:hypothetical protein